MRDSSSVHNGGPNVIDQLLLDKLLAIINGVEYFADGQWRSGVLTDKPEALLQLRGNRILEPEQIIRLEALSQARRSDRREPMRGAVQQQKMTPEFVTPPCK